MGLNDDAWKWLFERYDIVDRVKRDRYFIISAAQIKEYREPRLMTKFDHIINLPEIFRKNELAILPITRGDYIISSFSAYQDFPPEHCEKTVISLPADIQSLSSQFLVSEAIALNCAAACGILSDFLGEKSPVGTVSGRMGSGQFDFQIDTSCGRLPVGVNNAQIEIDAAYEASRCLALVEAKLSKSKDFLIRQLYYPFRTWVNRVSKTVRPVFLVFSGGVFHLYEYRFEDPAYYNSLVLVRQKQYAIRANITLDDIGSLLRTVRPVNEPDIPFPQANDFSRVVNLLELIAQNPMTHAEITAQYLFVPRQTGYYTNAVRYLGLAERERLGSIPQYRLTDKGRQLMSLNMRERKLALIRAILEHEIFHRLLSVCLNCGQLPDTAFIAQIMQECGVYHVEHDSTFTRRASSVRGWLRWVLSCAQQ